MTSNNVKLAVENVSKTFRVRGGQYLLSGETDMCALSGFGQVLPAIEKGAKLKVLAGGALLGLQAILTKNPAIKSVKDLEGRTVGTGSFGALLHQLVVALLRKKGVDEKKVTFVNVGSSTDVFRAIAAGTVDAGPCEAWLSGRAGTRAVEEARFFADLPEYTYQASYTSERAIARKRDAIVRTLAGFAANAGIGREGPPKAGWQAKERKETSSYRELFADPDALGAELFRRTGLYPMHSTLVIKDEILKANPWLPKAMFDAFQESKLRYVNKLRNGESVGKNAPRYLKLMKVVGDDPLPYGLAINRRSIETLILYAFQQKLIPRMLSVDELFINTG